MCIWDTLTKIEHKQNLHKMTNAQRTRYCDPDNELRTVFKVTKCQAIDLKLFQAASTQPKFTL